MPLITVLKVIPIIRAIADGARMNYLRSRIRSFRHAFAGVAILVRTQPNARIHLIAALLVGAAGIWFQLNSCEWCGIVFAIVGVWVAEALNTSVEFLADAVHSETHPLVKNAKDIGAAAVLIASIGALVIGSLVFGPKLLPSVGVTI